MFMKKFLSIFLVALLILRYSLFATAYDAVRHEVIENIKAGNININYYLNVAKENNVDINEYIKAPYLNTSISTALERGKPFLLVYANFNDLPTVVMYLKSSYQLYSYLGNDYEYVIINTVHPDNAHLLEKYKAPSLPYLYVANPNNGKIIPIKPSLYKKPKTLAHLINKYVRNSK